jgi:hypothetical protein
MFRMKQHFHLLLLSSRRAKLLLLALGTLLLLSACVSYSPSRHYPPAYYSVQASAGYNQPNYAYYGAWQPGWFVAAPYYPGNYWGYGAMVYWPTYSSSYYYSNHYYGGRAYYGNYYPYSDPWYYPYSGHYRHVYGHYYGPYNGPYYGYGGHNGSGYRPSSGRPYYGGSNSYRPPGGQVARRPDPAMIPPAQQDRYQPERRSATVVVEQEGLSRSVGVAPGGDGRQGMVVSNRNERKAQPSRLHPVAAGNSTQIPAPNAPVMPEARTSANPNNTNPVYVAPARNAAVVTPERRGFNTNSAAYRAPARGNSAPAFSQPDAPRPEPGYQHQLDPGSVAPRAAPRAERGQNRDTERGQDIDHDRDRQ